MSDYERWGRDAARPWGDDRDRDFYRRGPRSDRGSGRRDQSESFGRGSRDYPGPYGYEADRTGAFPYGSEAYGEERGFGRASEWRDSDRSGYRRDLDADGFGWGGRDRYGRGPDLGGRSMSELAFGRDGSGRERPRDYGRESRDRDRDDRGWFERAGDEVASWFGDEDAERRRRIDAREDERYGEHRGRGPRSYRRSDERIRDDLNDRLTDDHRLDASDIEVSVQDREVTLTGKVATRTDKRRAEDIAESISGVTHVQNNLRVEQHYAGSWATEPAAGTLSGDAIGQRRSSLDRPQDTPAASARRTGRAEV